MAMEKKVIIKIKIACHVLLCNLNELSLES